MGHAPAGLFGYSGMRGRYPGRQADYLRVPHADMGPIKIDSDLPDEQVLFLSDIFPTGCMAAENAGIEAGDTVAVLGCGPVGQSSVQCAWMFGAERVIAIDRVSERLEMARIHGRAETLNFDDEPIHERLMEMTGGRSPDRCIDAVEAGEIDPPFLITHRISMEDAPEAYEKFRTKTDGCIKVVIKPGMNGSDLKSQVSEQTSEDDSPASIGTSSTIPVPAFS